MANRVVEIVERIERGFICLSKKVNIGCNGDVYHFPSKIKLELLGTHEKGLFIICKN